jgi:hypothetical protein
MPNTTTLNETVRTLDGTEWVRLATPGANWRAQVSAIETFFQAPLTSANDTNVTITLGGSPSICLLAATSITMGWTGTLAAGRLNANVVQGVTNDTNVTGSIASQVLTLGWTGTLAAGRLNANVVQSVVNDTNVTGTIASQALTLGWTGTLAVGRGGTGDSTLTTNGVLYGNAASAVNVTAAAGANMVLWANSGAPSFTAAPVIGTSVTCPLHIGGTAAGSTLSLESTSGAGTSDYINFLTGSQVERGRIDTGGNVNFGMNGAILSGANSEGLTPRLQLAWANAVQSLELRQYTADVNPAVLTFVKSRSNTLGTNAASQASDIIGQINFEAYDTTPTVRNLAAIQAFVDGTPSASSFPGALIFNTATSGANTQSEKWRMNNAGTLRYLVLPTGASVIDGTASTQLNIANGANALIATSTGDGGLVIVTNNNTGDVGFYLVNNNGCVFVSSTLGNWVASTTTPATGKMSITNAGNNINIYNNRGAASLFRVFTVFA